MSTRLFLNVGARSGLLAWAALCFVSSCARAQNAPKPSAQAVKLEKNAQGFRLLRGGKPYFIKGAGGDKKLDLLAASGGNSVRTWGAEQLDTVLPLAKKQNVSVCAGLWMGHERHGFKYDDVAAVEK